MGSPLAKLFERETFDGFLFDLDGTLIDSTPAIERAWSTWGERHGLTISLPDVHGRPSRESIAQLLPDADEMTIDREHALLDALECEDTLGVVPLSGVLELIAELDQNATPWTVVTSCTRALARARMEAVGLAAPTPFPVVTSSDVRRGKPDPEPFLLGAARLGLAPSDCLAIEDAPAGIVAAKAAGMQVAAVATTHRADELGLADVVVSGVKQLVEFVPRRGRP